MDLVCLIIGIIGAIVTVISAIYAYLQAEKARKSATEAKLMKNTIEREYKKNELGKLLNSTKATIEQTIHLTTTANPSKKVRGLNYENVISVLRRFIDNLKENCHYLPDKKETLTVAEYKKVESHISELVIESD
jgi:hypothetical protein